MLGILGWWWFFFFSSRRRDTRFKCDWSSDVCSSDLKPLDTVTHLEGELAPYESVAIHARANGFVSKVLVDRGSQVKKGQLLLTLVAPELNAQRAEAQAKLEGDKSTSERLSAASRTPGAVAGHE